MSITGDAPKVKCRNCDRLWDFEDLEIFTERHGLSSPPYEQFLVCPICKSTNLDDFKGVEEDD